MKKKSQRTYLYFAYGANLNLESMAQRCPAAKALSPATLKGYTLEFRGNGSGCGVAHIEPAKGQEVPGGLWEITDACLASLDRFEGYPHLYGRKMVTVTLPDGSTTEAIAYFMKRGVPSVPGRGYVNCILDGYKDFGLDDMPLWRAVTNTVDLVKRQATMQAERWGVRI